MTTDCIPDTGQKLRFLTLDKLDGRTLAARKARDLLSGIETDLGGDLTAAKRELAQRAAVMGAYLEDWEARWLSGEPVTDVANYLAAANNQRRMFETLGLDRKARDVSLDSYLAHKTPHAPPDGQEEAS
jgi:hypothetical protein